MRGQQTEMNTAGVTRIGTIFNSHGVKGEVKVMPITVEEALFLEMKQLIIDEGDRQRELSVLRSRPVNHYWLIQFEGITDRDAAKDLMGAGVCVRDDQLRPLAEDEFFIHDLIGAAVYSTDDQYLGELVGFFEAGSQGVCEVKSGDGVFLFPASQEVLRDIDPGRRVVIQLLPGLLDLNR